MSVCYWPDEAQTLSRICCAKRSAIFAPQEFTWLCAFFRHSSKYDWSLQWAILRTETYCKLLRALWRVCLAKMRVDSRHKYYLQVKDTIPLLHLRLLHQMFKALNLRASSGSGRRSDRNSSGSSNRTPSLANTTVSMHRFITPSLASSGTTIGRSTSTYSSTNASSLASSRWNIQAISYGNQNRIRCTNSTALDVLSTVCFDPSQPNVYFGSARYADTIRPCKIVRVVSPVDHLECYVVAGHTAILHNEYFDLLSYDASVYELVEAQSGVVPPGKRPVNGGYDQQGRALYHGIALHSESGRKYRVPGEVSEHTVSICFRWTFFLRWRRT